MKENRIEVYLNSRPVGILAETASHSIAFQYTDTWLENGFAISPFSLPPERRIFIPDSRVFRGLWGVFNDSLPDAWGRLLVDRMLRKRNIDPDSLSMLDRLAVVGSAGMGALTYQPAWTDRHDALADDLDVLSAQCQAILNREEIDEPDRLFELGGSSGGARPKIVTEEWIIKFPASRDMDIVGLMEKEYHDTAAACGITVPECRLMPSSKCPGYYAVRRFDRQNGKRVHMATAAAILETDWRLPSLDYNTLMKMTSILSRGNKGDLQQMYRRMCFNVYAHNRDDHAKNFTWIYDSDHDCWHPSPAYDLTRSTTYYGEHTTTVDGNGKDPGEKELLSVGKKAGLSQRECREMLQEVQEAAVPLEQKYRHICQ